MKQITQVLPSEKRSFVMMNIIFFLLSTTIVSNVYFMIPLAADIRTTYNLTEFASIITISIFTLFYAIGLLLFGKLSQIFGLKQTICYGLLFLATFMILGFFSTNYYIFIFFRGLQGFFAASYAPVAYLYVFKMVPNDTRSTVISVINGGFLSASLVGQIVSSTITIFLPWQYVFLIFALFYVLLYFLSNQLLKSPRPDLTNTVIFKPFKLLTLFELRILYFITFTLLLTFVAFFTTFTVFLTNVLELNSLKILLIRIVSLSGIFLSIFLIKKIINNIGLIHTSILGLLTTIIGLAFSSIPNIYAVVIGCSFVGFGISITIPTIIQLIEQHSKQMRQMAISLYSFILLLGASLGGLISILNNPLYEYSLIIAIAVFNIGLLYKLKVLSA